MIRYKIFNKEFEYYTGIPHKTFNGAIQDVTRLTNGPGGCVNSTFQIHKVRIEETLIEKYDKIGQEWL